MRSIKTKLFSLGMAASMLLALGGCAMSTPANVGSIGGVEIPAGVYLLAQYNSYNTASGLADLATGETANDVKTVLKAQCTGTINGEEVTTDGADYISQLTSHAIEYYAAVEKEFDELGGVLDDAATAEAANSADSLWNSNGDLYTANGISKSTVETYLLNAQKAKAILNLTYGADGTSPVTEAEYTDYVNNDCYYVETVQFPLVNYSSYSLATDDQKSQIEDIAAQCLAELTGYRRDRQQQRPVHRCHELRAPGHERHGQHDRVCPGGLLRRFQAVHPGRSLQLWRRRLQQPDRPAG